MLEISPVLAGTFDQPNYAPAATNLSTSATEDANGVDSRRYTKFDRTAADAGSADLSFGDFLDMVNPLEHIPLVSSVYRAVTGDNINPVSHVVGDIMYGGAMGGVSALAGGVGAVAEEVFQAQTGKSGIEYVSDALFGSGDDAPQTQVASATPAPNTNAASSTSPPAPAAAPVAAVTAASAAGTPQTAPGVIPLASGNAAQAAANGLPLNGNKLPFGGVMDTGNRIQAQDMAMALQAAAPAGIRIGHTVYTNGLMNGSRPAPVVGPAPQAAAAPAAASTSSGSGDGPGAQNSLPQGLMNDIIALKALNQYRNTASAPATPGATVNTLN